MIREFLQQGGIIKDIYLVDTNNTQVVFLLHDAPISEESAKIWWNGYSEGLKAALG